MRGKDLDGADGAALRRRVLKEKTFLKKIYEEWYRTIADAVSGDSTRILEIGSSGGFLSEFIPGLITSDILFCPWIQTVLDGTALPFKNESLDGIVMTNVFHHFQRPRDFFSETIRCLKPGGSIMILEPWNSPWSRLVYKSLHHEPFDHKIKQWEIPMEDHNESPANNALPWTIFSRDRKTFEKEFPQLRIVSVKRTMPFRYLLSGGMYMRSFIPGWGYGMARMLELGLSPLNFLFAMFAYVKITKDR